MRSKEAVIKRAYWFVRGSLHCGQITCMLCRMSRVRSSPRGGPKRRFKDQLERSLAQANIPDNNWETIAHERHSWKVRVREGVEAFEAERRSQVDLKRQERKRRHAATPPPATLPCDYCPRLFRHRLGLLSHVRAHKRHQKDS